MSQSIFNVCADQEIGILKHQGRYLSAYPIMKYGDFTQLTQFNYFYMLTYQEIIEVAAELVLAIEDFHKTGFWHLDIKLGNVVISKGGHVRLIDFEHAREANENTTRLDYQSCGTVDYDPYENYATEKFIHKT